MSDPKTISRSQYLQALGLYTMAQRLAKDVDRFNAELNKLLELDAPSFDNSRVSDGIYCDEPFDLVLGYENITVEPEAS